MKYLIVSFLFLGGCTTQSKDIYTNVDDCVKFQKKSGRTIHTLDYKMGQQCIGSTISNDDVSKVLGTK